MAGRIISRLRDVPKLLSTYHWPGDPFSPPILGAREVGKCSSLVRPWAGTHIAHVHQETSCRQVRRPKEGR
jgi:hypothetical protein